MSVNKSSKCHLNWSINQENYNFKKFVLFEYAGSKQFKWCLKICFKQVLFYEKDFLFKNLSRNGPKICHGINV